MRHAGALALMGALVLAGCQKQDQPPAPKPSPTVSATPAAPDWPHAILGEWVSSPDWPTGGHDDNCATDFTFGFTRDGIFGTGDASGTWRLDGNRLTTTLTEEKVDEDDPAPGQTTIPTRKLAKPVTLTTTLVAIKDGIITAQINGKREYWFRCAKGS